MLKLLCPNCMRIVMVAEESAGTDAPCPECGKLFPIPARYNPVVSAAAPSANAPVPSTPLPMNGPSPAPYPSPAAPVETPAPASSPLPFGYSRSFECTLSPRVLAWVPAIGLTLIFILTFFPWVGVYPSGYLVYGQGAWRALSGTPTQSPQLEEFMLKELPKPPIYDRTR